jgi:predicted RND superfamily exporter protein
MDRLSAFILRRGLWILGVSGVVVVVSVLGLPRLTREVDMIGYFPSKSPIHIAETLMEDKFGGSLPIQLSVHGDMHDPLVLKEAWAFQKFLETIPAVNHPQSIASLIAEMNHVMNGRYCIPDTREEVENLWFFLEGEETLEQLVDSESSWGLIQANMGSVNTESIRETVDAVDVYVAAHVNGGALRLSLGSDASEKDEKARTEHLERISRLIRDDVASRKAGSPPDPSHVYEILTRFQAGTRLILTTGEEADLSRRIAEYYAEELAQVPIAQTAVVAAQLSSLATETVPTEEEIAAVLRNHSVEVSDEEGILIDAGALQAAAREARGDYRADRALGELQALLSPILQQDTALQRRLRGDLWELNHSQVLVPGDGVGSEAALTAEQTGIPIIYKHLDDNLVKTQIVSLLITAALVMVMMALQFRSLVAGLLGVIPFGLTVLINFGVMSYLGVAIDTATVLVGSIAIGIGIDYTIHFLWRFRSEATRHGAPLEVLDATLETTGRAILINAVTVGLGFLVLIFASVVPLRHFGWLTSLTMASSALAALCVLPAVILVFKPRFIGTLMESNHASSAEQAGANGLKEE